MPILHRPGYIITIMIRPRRVFRAIATVIAAGQFAVTAAAPAAEALLSAGQLARYHGTGDSVDEAPRHAHDASTCSACRVLQSPVRLESCRYVASLPSPASPWIPFVSRAVLQLTSVGFLSRAPPSLPA